MGCAWLDQHNLKNADDLFAVLARHPQQKTILFGHVHQEFDEVHHGVRLIASPSTCIQFKPLSDGFALDESGGLALSHPAPGWPGGESGVAPAAGAVRARHNATGY